MFHASFRDDAKRELPGLHLPTMRKVWVMDKKACFVNQSNHSGRLGFVGWGVSNGLIRLNFKTKLCHERM